MTLRLRTITLSAAINSGNEIEFYEVNTGIRATLGRREVQIYDNLISSINNYYCMVLQCSLGGMFMAKYEQYTIQNEHGVLHRTVVLGEWLIDL